MNIALPFVKYARSYIAQISLSIKIKFGWLGIPKIVPFIGYSNGFSTFISGEVLEDNGISKPVEGQSRWKNAKSMLKRYLADEYAGIKVRISFAGQFKEETTNKFGAFHCSFQHNRKEIPDELWQKATFELVEKIHPRQNSETVEGEVMVINYKPSFGIISDIDDTILVSYATNKLMKFRLMFLNNALTRMPFEGVSAFYQSLQHGIVPGTFNPLFYLSNSEWNLYDLLYEFIKFNRIPKGPILLREMSIRVLRFWKMREYNKHHKMEKLRHLLTVFGDLKFILIGDSGQKDPETYSEIIREYPGRIQAVYIRDIGIPRKTIRVQTISQSALEEFNTEMILVKDTEAAAKHAIMMGFMRKEEITHIKEEKQKDLQKKEVSVST